MSRVIATRKGREICKGTQRNTDGSEGDINGSGKYQNQDQSGIRDQDGSGRILHRNGKNEFHKSLPLLEVSPVAEILAKEKAKE